VPKKITASIIGATGYTGLELIRLINGHPAIALKYITSESAVGEKLSDIWPHLKGICELTLSALPLEKIAQESDCVFLALPHFQSQKIVQKLFGLTKIIDLSADFRLKNPLKSKEKFIYGIPELYKNDLIKADNIANPGCFATAIELALMPIKKLLNFAYILGITGSSGSGKLPADGTHHPLRSHNIKSYKIGTHQHEAEICQTLNISPAQFVFVPTSGPFVRGIHVTAFVDFKKPLSKEKIIQLFQTTYENAPFVRVKNEVQVVDVVGSNYCDISVNFCNGKAVIQAVIDNLVKGASGNAIQNFNLMFGLDETAGLKTVGPLFP